MSSITVQYDADHNKYLVIKWIYGVGTVLFEVDTEDDATDLQVMYHMIEQNRQMPNSKAWL